jgi:hypothetical protein
LSSSPSLSYFFFLFLLLFHKPKQNKKKQGKKQRYTWHDVNNKEMVQQAMAASIMT